MAADTAKGAEKKDTRTITFKNKEHRDLYKEYLHEIRQASGSAGIIQMAFNLYHNGTPNIDDSEDVEDRYAKDQDARDKEGPSLVPAALRAAGRRGCEVCVGTICKQRDR